MKYCPRCQADVEGLLYRCDCCGASLEPPKKRLFYCSIFELPQCLGFAALTYEMIDAIQPDDLERFIGILERVDIRMICYPESILADGKIKAGVRYYPKKSEASLNIVVDFEDFVYADRDEKARLVAEALRNGIHALEARLQKHHRTIDGIVANADTALSKYIL